MYCTVYKKDLTLLYVSEKVTINKDMVLRALAKWNPRVELACTLTSARETRPGNRKQSFLYMVAKVTPHRPLKLSTLSVICIFFLYILWF